MTEMEIFTLESRIDSINNAIAQMRKDATSATKANVEMAIEMLALPELAKVEAQKKELARLARLEKILADVRNSDEPAEMPEVHRNHEEPSYD